MPDDDEWIPPPGLYLLNAEEQQELTRLTAVADEMSRQCALLASRTNSPEDRAALALRDLEQRLAKVRRRIDRLVREGTLDGRGLRLAGPVIAPVVEFGLGAIGSGVIGGAAYESAKAAVSRVLHRRPSMSDHSDHESVWSAARMAILDRYADRLLDADDTLALQPHTEEIGSDGRWVVQFSTELGHNFTVILGPPRRRGDWRGSVRAVKRELATG